MRVSHLLGAAIFALGLTPQCNRSPAPSANLRGPTRSERPLVHSHPLIEPPFVREWTQLVGEQAFVVAVREGIIYYCSHNGVGALDLATGQRKWSSLSGQRIAAATIQGGTLYAISQVGKACVLVAVNIRSRQPRTLARLAVDTQSLATDFRYLYVLDPTATLRAYDPISGAVIWSRRLQREKSLGASPSTIGAQLVTTRDGVYVGLGEPGGAPGDAKWEGFGPPGGPTKWGEFAVDPKDGTTLWHRSSPFVGQHAVIVIGGDIISQQDRLRRINVRTGKVAWRTEEWCIDAVRVANIVVCNGQNGLSGRDVTDGRLLWRLPLRDRNMYSASDRTSIISDGENVWISRKPVVCVTKNGRIVWNRPEPFTGTPAYADHARVVTADGERILGYGAGTLPPLPTADPEKRALAERLASQFEILDNAERGQLEKLVPFSFQLLLARYVGWTKAWDAKRDYESRSPYFRLIKNVRPLLHATYRKEDTGALMSAWSSLEVKSRGRSELERILQEKGDPSDYLPVLVKNLRSVPPKERRESVALAVLSQSSHPEAVALMLETLRNPDAAEAWRQEAFRHLAGTGGPEGVQAVREVRPRRGPRKPWFDRIDLSKLARDAKLDTKTDANGRTWMLFHSDVLGNGGDLFVVRKLGSKWGRPLFTGAWTAPYADSPAPKAFRGVPTAKLLSSEWIRILPDDPAIRRDSDGDGLTDVVESRLGTDPAKADMDGDGLVDPIDPCPNAAPRALGDTEKILAACVEAWFFLHDWEVPAVLSVEGVAPFELYGYAPMVMWQMAPRTSPLREVYRGGVNLIGFEPPGTIQRPGTHLIEYGHDRKTAHTTLIRVSGGLNGEGMEITLKKVGDDWFAMDLEMRWAS